MSVLTGGFTGQLSSDAVQTAIDEVMYESFSREETPVYLRATDELFFKQKSDNKLVYVWDEDSNVGAFDEVDEQEEIPTGDSFIGNQTSKASQKYFKRIPISDEAFKADQVSKRESIGKNIGDRARVAQDKQGVLNSYGDFFAGSINTTPDGQAMASNSHVTLTGTTVDNLETGSLTPDNLWTMVNSLAQQYGQDGEAGGHNYVGMLVPFTLYKTAKEVQNSELHADSAENNLNVFETDYGQVQIRASVYLNSQYNAASYANTSYHIIGQNHHICRYSFYDLYTEMVEPKYSDNDTWEIKAKFHETTFPGTWTAYVGSNGTV